MPKEPILSTLMAQHPSLKRLAWAYGCAKKGSSEEDQLRRALLDHVVELLVDVRPTEASPRTP